MKIHAAIDILGGKVVRLVKGQERSKIIYSDDPISVAKKWVIEGADMLHLVDLDAALDTGVNNYEIIGEIIKSVNIPIQIGGGLRSEETVNKMFAKGISRVVLGTFAYHNPYVVRKMSRQNSEGLVISVDQLEGRVMIKGWKVPSNYTVGDAISKFSKIGITNFLLTSIDRDGTLEGPDVEAVNEVCSDRALNVIASGGISSLVDLIRLKAVGCNEVILGKALYEGKLELRKAKAIS